MSITTLFRQSRLRLDVCLSVSANSNPAGWEGQSRLRKALSVVLLSVILAVIGAIVYMAVAPHVGEKFTEFYILGPEAKAENYPTEIALGEEARVIVGIVNHEYEEVSYRVVVRIDETTRSEIGPVVMAHEAKWEPEVSFIPTKVGENQKVQFLLYKNGQEQPYLTLRLWINVEER